MTNLYFVKHWVNNGYNYDIDTVAVWLDKEFALDLASRYHLEHDEVISVEEREEGVQHGYKVKTIYEYKHYDHTYVLFSMCWFGIDKYLTQDEVIHECILMASPMITENVDFDKLYRLYTEQFNYDETFD